MMASARHCQRSTKTVRSFSVVVGIIVVNTRFRYYQRELKDGQFLFS